MTTKPGSMERLRKYYRARLKDLNYRNIVEALENESDRSFIIVYASILEDRLSEAIRNRLIPLSEKQEQKLQIFNFDGPFGSFRNKISVAYALGIIDQQKMDALNEIRDLRNAAAHSLMPISFQIPEVVSVVARIVQTPPFEESHSEEARGKALRSAFTLFCIMSMMQIDFGAKEGREKFKKGIDHALDTLLPKSGATRS